MELELQLQRLPAGPIWQHPAKVGAYKYRASLLLIQPLQERRLVLQLQAVIWQLQLLVNLVSPQLQQQLLVLVVPLTYLQRVEIRLVLVARMALRHKQVRLKALATFMLMRELLLLLIQQFGPRQVSPLMQAASQCSHLRRVLLVVLDKWRFKGQFQHMDQSLLPLPALII